jgi:hypothetical protein
MGSELVKPDHLDRKAVVYVRQSTPHQVVTNQESLKLQYALSQRARELGWREADINVIDSDLGQSGAGAAHRKGFKDLVARVTLGEIGLVLSMDVTRLARNCSDWYPEATTYPKAALGMDGREAELPDLPVTTAYHDTETTPVLFGHYWLQGAPVIAAGHAACLDDSVAKQGFLTAYRWSGETTLSPANIVYVSA